MPTSNQNHYNIRRLRIVFAASSVALLGAMIWLISVDHVRPWRAIQDDYADLQAGLTRLDLLVLEHRDRELPGRYANEIAQARKRLAELTNETRREIINAPLVDFAAPRRTPAHHQIRQEVLPGVRQDLHFAKTSTTDRCRTCHVAIDNAAFTRKHLAERFAQALAAINARRTDSGRPRFEFPVVASRKDLAPSQLPQYWQSLTKPQQDDLFNGLLQAINEFQQAEGYETLEFRQPLLAHPQLELYVGSGSPHPLREMGCTVCHEGNGAETDFVLAGHTPASQRIRREWENKYYVRTAGLWPAHTFESAAKGWPRPMLTADQTEANCARCHPDIADTVSYDYQPLATRINEGRYLFASLGCTNCHSADSLNRSPRVGPALDHVGEKLTRAFIRQWVLSPRSLRPITRMPHSFGQENNDGRSVTRGDKNPERRTRTEIAAIAEYLHGLSRPYGRIQPPPSLWKDLQDETSEKAIAAAERGRQLVNGIGCLACHTILGHHREDADSGPEAPMEEEQIVADLVDKFEQFIARMIVASAATNPNLEFEQNVSLKDVVETIATTSPIRLGQEGISDKGDGLSFTWLAGQFEKAFPEGAYDPMPVVLEAYGPRNLSIPDVLAGFRTDAIRHALPELSDDVEDAVWNDAYQRFDAMSRTNRLEYMMWHFNDVADTFCTGDTTQTVLLRFGPELSAVRNRLGNHAHAVEWIYDWLKNPRRYSATARMPRIDLQQESATKASASGDSAPPGLETDEALDIAVYLSRLGHIQNTIPDLAFPEFTNRDQWAEDRDTLIRGLLTNVSATSDIDAFLNDRNGLLTSRLLETITDSPENALFRERIMAANLDTRKWWFLGRAMVAHYGCAGCHSIPGFPSINRIGPELSKWGQKPLTELDFGLFDPLLRTDRKNHSDTPDVYEADPNEADLPVSRQRLIHWAGGNAPADVQRSLASYASFQLRNPRMWDRDRDKTARTKRRMPNFFLRNRQIEAIITFLLSRKPGNVTPEMRVGGEEPASIGAGRNLARQYNCIACHRIDGNMAAIEQYYAKWIDGERVLDAADAPPPLQGLGARAKGNWLLGYLRQVETIRPWLDVRMPTFELRDDEAIFLISYLAQTSQAESAWLRKQLNEIDQAIGVATDETSSPSDSAEAWYQRDMLLETAARMRRYANVHRLVPANMLSVLTANPTTLAWTHDSILENSRLLAEALAIRDPFVDPAETIARQTQIADGETIFTELQCLQCHVFGDPTAAGANPRPTAPDLQRTDRRLRTSWMRKWLQNPPTIRPGTRMPSFFGANREGAFRSYPPAARERLQARFHDKELVDHGAAQIEAVIRFLQDASLKHQNIVRNEPSPVETVNDL